MHLRTHSLLLVLVSGLLGISAHAAGNTEYLSQRNRLYVTTLPTTNALIQQFPAHAGQVIEVQGEVYGVTSGGVQPGFLLHIDSRQTLVLAPRLSDPDVAVGKTLRVLARIPQHGVVLETLCVTPAMVEPATVAITPAPANSAVAIIAPAATSLNTNPPVAAPARVSPTPVVRTGSPSATITPPAAPTTASNVPAEPAPVMKIASSASAPRTGRRHHKGRRIAATRPRMANAHPHAAHGTQVSTLTRQIRQFNSNVNPTIAAKIATHVVQKCQQYGVDPRLVVSLIAQESHFNPRAVSAVGARGLGQLMPGTAALMGITNPFDIAQNVAGTVRYLAQQLAKFGGDITRALAAYNAGPGNVVRFGGIPPFQETQNYVRVIFKHFNDLMIHSD